MKISIAISTAKKAPNVAEIHRYFATSFFVFYNFKLSVTFQTQKINNQRF